MQLASHAWITRSLFPRRSDSARAIFILEFDPDDKEAFSKVYDLVQEFSKEVGGSFASFQVGGGRFVLEGPEGFSIVEVAPAYTEEEYNKIIDSEGQSLDLSVWEQMFQTGLPQEPTPETDRSG